VIPEAPFLFSIAGISASLAGLAGLVAGLRRGTDLRPMDLFRLREIVEFAFANVILALSTVPMVLIVGDTGNALRIQAVIALLYTIMHIAVLVRRGLRYALPYARAWTAVAAIADLGIIFSVVATLTSGTLPVTIGAFEALLLVLVVRPMFAFLLVLASFDAT
jgi:hypothetical protein